MVPDEMELIEVCISGWNYIPCYISTAGKPSLELDGSDLRNILSLKEELYQEPRPSWPRSRKKKSRGYEMKGSAGMQVN